MSAFAHLTTAARDTTVACVPAAADADMARSGVRTTNARASGGFGLVGKGEPEGAIGVEGRLVGGADSISAEVCCGVCARPCPLSSSRSACSALAREADAARPAVGAARACRPSWPRDQRGARARHLSTGSQEWSCR